MKKTNINIFTKYKKHLIISGLVLAAVVVMLNIFQSNNTTDNMTENPSAVIQTEKPAETTPSVKPVEKLSILSCFPADGGQAVPVTTGIEFTFNNRNISPEDIKASFKVQPHVEGEFIYGDGRFVFYPTDKLEYNTKYSVSLSPPLISVDGAELSEAVSLSFHTAPETAAAEDIMFQLAGSGISRNSISSETPVVEAYIDENLVKTEKTVSIKIYRFDNHEGYFEQLRRSTEQNMLKYYDTAIYTKDLPEYAAFEIQPVPSTDNQTGYNSGRYVLQFPGTIPEGWYAVDFSIGEIGVTRQLFLQVSDISVFYMAYDKNMLVWVNDASTGDPVNNAEIKVTGDYAAEGITGADGTSIISDGKLIERNNMNYGVHRGIITVTAADRHFVDTGYFYNMSQYADEYESRLYMSCLFTDRPLYYTTDSIRVWGAVRPRDASTPVPEKLTLKLGAMTEQDITPKPDGTFTATITYEDMSPYYWTDISLLKGESLLTTKSIGINDYVKPIYNAKTYTSKPVYAPDLTAGSIFAEVVLDVSTFDGTPASAVEVAISLPSESLTVQSTENLVTSQNGSAVVPVNIVADPDTWYPQSYYYSFYNRDPQAENMYLFNNLLVIHRDVMLRGKIITDTGKNNLEISTNIIDISKVEKPEDVWNFDLLESDPVARDIKANVRRIYYAKEVTGTYYDFIKREKVESYRFVRMDDIIDSFTFTTENGTHLLKDLPSPNNESCYYLELSTTDTKGRTITSNVYLGRQYWNSGSSADGTDRYYFDKQYDPSEVTDFSESGGNIYYTEAYDYYKRSRFQENEEVTFKLHKNDEPVDTITGRLLYCVAQEEFNSVNISESSSISLEFNEKLLPNYVLTGAYFDGKHIYSLSDKQMSFDPLHRELEITLETDKNTYSPADTVHVSATVKNKQTGKPASNAEVVLSVADEAVFAIREQNNDILTDLYRTVYFPYIQKYNSYSADSSPGAAEKGGGGDAVNREKFQDTAFFSSEIADNNGKAGFSFKLPDNITSWRLSSVALTKNNHAGNDRINISATMPFFVMPIVNSNILEGDSFTVGLRGTGTEVDDSASVSYTVKVEGEGVNESKTTESTLRAYASLEFDGLKQGDYSVTVSAECGEYSDGVILPFNVIPHGVEISLIKSFELKNGIDIEPLRYPVTISFYDKAYRNYNTVFNSVLASSGKGRADSRLARKYVASYFAERGNDWYGIQTEESIADITTNRLINPFPYAEYDVEMSVKAYMTVPEYFTENLISNLSTADNWYTGAKSAIYLANALRGEPIAVNLAEMIESDNSLDYVDKMHLALALAYSGDKNAAENVYEKLIKPNLVELTGVSGEKAVYVNITDAKRSMGDCTAAASMLASVINAEEADSLVRYLAEKKSIYEPYIFEQMLYLKHFRPQNANASISYIKNGETVTEIIENSGIHRSFTKEQLQNANFKTISGDVYADVYYTGRPEQTADKSKKAIGLTKTVESVEGGEIKLGDRVKITLTPDISGLDLDIGGSTVMIIDDYIPSGMRFEQFSAQDTESGWYMTSRQGQKIQFYAYGAKNPTGIKPIVYFARCSVPGDYVVESAYITSNISDTWGATDRAAVSIR